MKIPVQLELFQTPVSEAEYRRAFDAMQRDHVDGVLLGPELEHYNHALGQLAQQPSSRLRLLSKTVESGALMSYAWDHKAADRRLAAQIVEILNGGNPADAQETHWEFVINLKAAKELGLECPQGWSLPMGDGYGRRLPVLARTGPRRCPQFGRYQGESGHGVCLDPVLKLTHSGHWALSQSNGRYLLNPSTSAKVELFVNFRTILRSKQASEDSGEFGK